MEVQVCLMPCLSRVLIRFGQSASDALNITRGLCGGFFKAHGETQEKHLELSGR